MKKTRENNALNIFKFISALLIVGSHCLPLFNNNFLNLFYGQYLFRFCVPLFFISTGYYFDKSDNNKRKMFIKRIFILYVCSTILYFPLFMNSGVKQIIFNCLFGYYHLWYLNAVLLGTIFIYLFDNHLGIKSKKFYFLLLLILLISGIFFDEYNKILQIHFLDKLILFFNKFGGGRNALFFAIPMLIIGKLIHNQKRLFEINWVKYFILLIFSVIVAFLEFLFLSKKIGLDITTDITLFNFVPSILLFILSFYLNSSLKLNDTKKMRKMADFIYVIHIYVIFILSRLFSLLHINLFIISSFISIFLSYVIITFFDRLKKSKKDAEI